MKVRKEIIMLILLIVVFIALSYLCSLQGFVKSGLLISRRVQKRIQLIIVISFIVSFALGSIIGVVGSNMSKKNAGILIVLLSAIELIKIAIIPIICRNIIIVQHIIIPEFTSVFYIVSSSLIVFIGFLSYFMVKNLLKKV